MNNRLKYYCSLKQSVEVYDIDTIEDYIEDISRTRDRLLRGNDLTNEIRYMEYSIKYDENINDEKSFIGLKYRYTYIFDKNGNLSGKLKNYFYKDHGFDFSDSITCSDKYPDIWGSINDR
jgi:hypothetical protein